MNIFLIIIGAIIFFICGFLALATHTAIKNQENWDDFYKSVEEKNLPMPEEAVSHMVCKMNFITSIGTIIGLILLFGGILLTAFTK